MVPGHYVGDKEIGRRRMRELRKRSKLGNKEEMKDRVTGEGDRETKVVGREAERERGG